jgi:hypothetical protein
MRIDIRPASATQLSNLVATANNVKTIDLSWVLPVDDPSYRAAQIWVNTVNDVETASLVTTVAGNYYSYTAPDTNGRYFWIRTVNEYNRTDGPFTGPAQATPKLLVTSDIGVFDLATANIINQLTVSKITGLGALATLSSVNASTQVTNLGGLAFADQIAANQIGAGTLAAGVIYAGTINADNITSGTITGRTVRTSSGSTRVEMASDNTLTFYSSGSTKAQIGAGGGNVTCYGSGTIPALYASGGSVAILCDGNFTTNGGTASLGTTTPSGSATLGTSGNAWAGIYSQTAVTVTSDVRAKTDIQDSDLGLDFIMKLRPISYRLAVGRTERVIDPDATGPFLPGQEAKVEIPYEGTRRHYGLPAQNVKEALGDLDAAIWSLDDPTNPDSRQALRYEELIAPLIKAMQEQQKMIERQTARIDALEKRLASA